MSKQYIVGAGALVPTVAVNYEKLNNLKMGLLHSTNTRTSTHALAVKCRPCIFT
jgi:hypothetical protein